MKAFFIYILLLGFSTLGYADGDLNERIVEVSREIQINPDSAFLYLKRGELYYYNEDYYESIGDYNYCNQLGYQSSRLFYGLACTYDKIENYKIAIFYLDKILAKSKHDRKSLWLKAKLLRKINRYGEAAIILEKVIQISEKPYLKMYLEAAYCWEQSSHQQALQKANNILYEGILKFGDLEVILEKLVEIHLNFGDYENAIFYQTKILNKSDQKEFAYFKRANIYLESGNYQNAKIDLRRTLASIDQLPVNVKQSNEWVKLKNEAKQNLYNLPADLAGF